MFYLHLLTGLISSNKYWRVAKNLLPLFKRGQMESSETSAILEISDFFSRDFEIRVFYFGCKAKSKTR